jgi:hypothetical protein
MVFTFGEWLMVWFDWFVVLLDQRLVNGPELIKGLKVKLQLVIRLWSCVADTFLLFG